MFAFICVLLASDSTSVDYFYDSFSLDSTRFAMTSPASTQTLTRPLFSRPWRPTPWRPASPLAANSAPNVGNLLVILPPGIRLKDVVLQSTNRRVDVVWNASWDRSLY
jgi:hypothetical protein